MRGAEAWARKFFGGRSGQNIRLTRGHVDKTHILYAKQIAT